MGWAPGATFVQQTAPTANSTYVSAATTPTGPPMLSQNLPTYGPPTTVVAPAQYMQPVVTMSEHAVPTTAFTGPAPMVTEAVQTYSAPQVVTQVASPPVMGSGVVPAAQTPALPALAPTTVVAAPQYMLPGSQFGASVTAEQPAMAGVTMTSLPQAVPTEPIQMAQPQALPSTTIVAPAQYMTGPTPVTTQSLPMATGSPVPVVTHSVAAPVATLGAFVTTPGASSMAVPGSTTITSAAQAGSMVLGQGALPMRGSLLKAGSITDDVFNMVDKDNDGVISRSEFRGALKGNVISATANTKLQLQGHL